MSSVDKYVQNFPVTWERLQQDARELSRRLIPLGPFKGIIAIARGGLIPAAILAREMEIRLIDTVCISTYDWQDKESSNVLKGIDSDGEGWLLVDDLVDTGTTAKVVRDMIPKAHFATLYAKPSGRPCVDTFITEVSQDTWVLFPWDSQVQFVEPVAKRFT